MAEDSNAYGKDPIYIKKKTGKGGKKVLKTGPSLVVQWWRVWVFSAGGHGFDPWAAKPVHHGLPSPHGTMKGPNDEPRRSQRKQGQASKQLHVANQGQKHKC